MNLIAYLCIFTLFITNTLFRSTVVIACNHRTESRHCSGKIVYPHTKEELISIITDATSHNHKIRVIGSGHSDNEIACSDDLLIHLKYLNQILKVNVDTQKVLVEGGMSLYDFNLQINMHGLALANLISVTIPTIAGVVCTASHGTGHTGSLSSFVTEIELITADGIVHQLSLENDKDAFQAACTSLGTLGVIYALTIQCIPAFKLAYHNITMHIHDMIAQYKQLHMHNNFFQFRWNTKTDIIIAEFWNRVPSDTPLSASVSHSFEALPCDDGKKYINQPHMSCEIAIPANLLPAALPMIKEFMKKWRQKGLDFTSLNGRFVKADTHAYLSPAQCDVVYLGIGHPTDVRYHQVYKDFQKLLYPLDGRPHWGKCHSMNYEKISLLYKDNFLKFTAVKKRLDPFNIFSNAYTDRILGNAFVHDHCYNPT